MDLRSLPTGLTPEQRCTERRSHVEHALSIDLFALTPREGSIGHADEKNCEQMLGHVPIPVGYAGPLKVTFSSGETSEIHLPLATTEGALVASVNRGCKALSQAGGVRLSSIHHGMTRSMAFRAADIQNLSAILKKREAEWKQIGHSTSNHLKILTYDVDIKDDHLFLTISCDTDEAMGMNMVTIAAQKIGEWIESECDDVTFVTVAGNVDSDKKPSKRTHDRGRGYEVTATAEISEEVLKEVLKTSSEAMLATAHAKLTLGSEIAGAIGRNLHAANIFAALYLATGQDAAHVVEGSLTETTIQPLPTVASAKVGSNHSAPAHRSLGEGGIRISVRCPAILVGIRGGGTTLPAQSQCLQMLMKPKTALHPKAQLAESIGAAVLAGEISLLAAQASHSLAQAHTRLGRT